MDTQNLEHVRHSLAHLLAAAVMDLYPDTKRTIGPAIENGFYFDFEFSKPITPMDLLKIEKRMRKILPTWKKFERHELTADEAKKEYPGNQYKHELIDEFTKDGQKVSFYKSGEYWDLCKGGHSDNPAAEIDSGAFKLTKIAGAYWRGDEKNAQLTRIYGVAFASKAELDAYLTMMAEAEKRDHKKLGKELALFAFSPLAGPGFPLFLPKGEVIFRKLEEFMREEKEKLGYSFVRIPHVAKAELYVKSGHLGKYDAMMPIMTDAEGGTFAMKAMNCPHHFEIYNAQPHSYKGLPYRIAETTTVYRNEKSGEVSGLVRVKALTQDDTHHVVRTDQIQSEIDMILGLMDRTYKTFGFSEYKIQISIRDPKNPAKYFGDNALWEKSEKILIDAVTKWGRPFVVEEGEAAFYGPKIDIMVKDSIGRMWQLTTVQLDFNQPENFDMTYAGEDGAKHRPAILHVAILGSVERFMGILIEHYAGHFPLWLSPVQARVIAVSEKYQDYGTTVLSTLKAAGIRAELADSDETLGKRIRAAQIEKIPYVLVVGEEEVSAGTVAAKLRGADLGKLTTADLIAKIQKEVNEKSA